MSVVVGVACAWWITPRLTTFFDRHLTRQRFVSPASTPTQPIVAPPQQLQPSATTAIDIVEEAARLVRAGVHARDVVEMVVRKSFPPSQHEVLLLTLSTSSIAEILRECSAHSERKKDYSLLFHLMMGAYVDGVFIPAALDHAAATLRSHSTLAAELRSATTQAVFTTRILTYLPIVALTVLLLFSSQTRQRLFHLPMIFTLGIGLALNRCGALWIRGVIRRVLYQPVDEVVVLTEHLVTSLRAGCSIPHALERWRAVSPLGTYVANELAGGAPIHQALKKLPTTSSSIRLVQTIESSLTDGLPLTNTVHRLVGDAQNSLRQHSETLIRQLPTRLSFPLVLCVLPSFLFITIVPMMMNAFASLGPVLSPAVVPLS